MKLHGYAIGIFLGIAAGSICVLTGPKGCLVVAGAIVLSGLDDAVQLGTWTDRHMPRIVGAYDPNEKLGSKGYRAPEQHVAGEEPLRYAVLFENVATATAPAQEVLITDQLDAASMDLSTCTLGPIGFGSTQVIPPTGLCEFMTDVDLRPGQNLLVRIAARLDQSTGALTWRLTSLDPATGLPPDDPLAGFVPPNVTPPEGEGRVFFTIMPKSGLATGTVIRNRASIVFDTNQPILTPEWVNTIDNTKPASEIAPLSALQASRRFPLQWSGSDVGAGVQDYSIFVSENGGSFRRLLRETTSTATTFSGIGGKTYAFYSSARDGVRNVEDAPSNADATTTIGASFSDVSLTGLFSSWVEALAAAGITSGCATDPPQYCPNDAVTREQMAVFLLRGLAYPGTATPPVPTGTVFADVPLSNIFVSWIEGLFAAGITGGCGTNPLRYCPGEVVTRDQMAIFLLRAKHGAGYVPPAPAGQTFADVPLGHPFAAWIYQLATEGITGGCATGPARYCPSEPVTRAQMAVFLVRTFNLPN